MDAVDFLHSDAADLPMTRVGDFQTFMGKIFCDFQANLSRIIEREFIDKIVLHELSKVQSTSKAVLEVIELGIAGDRDAAYNLLDATLTSLGPHFATLMPTGDMSKFIAPIYRFRAAGADPYSKGDLFHIPFQLRHMVGPMRYSVAGLPSLYLGGSTHVCWRELGEPNLDTIVVSRFNPIQNTDLRVLNFGLRLPLLAAYVAARPDEFTTYTKSIAMVAGQVACWPLMAACSIRVPDRTRLERPEYMIPQLVLEWITKTHAYNGIRYFSTHYSEYPDDPKTYMNYVFPARTTAASGYCSDLCGLFELTDPIPWTNAKSTPPTSAKRPRYKTREVLNDALEAEFGRAEDGLLSLPVGPLRHSKLQ